MQIERMGVEAKTKPSCRSENPEFHGFLERAPSTLSYSLFGGAGTPELQFRGEIRCNGKIELAGRF